MKLLNTTLAKLILIFVAGILAGFYIAIALHFLFFIVGFVFFLFCIAFIRAKKQFFQDFFFGTSCFLLFFTLGILTTNLHLPKNQAKHYTNQITSEKNQENPMVLVSIKEQLKPGFYQERFIAEVKKINNNPAHGNLLLLFQKDSIQPFIRVDDLLLFSAEMNPIQKPLNPYQFNYKKFMANRDIFHQVSLQKKSYLQFDSAENSLRGMAAKFRNTIVSALEQHHFQKEEMGIIQALLLGQRQDISPEIYENYAAAGVLHILAVSGLHVGLILLILNWILSPMDKFKKGKFLKTAILVFLLWCFAVIAGLSPSVVRAVTMFTFVAIALQLKRRTSAINTLFMSMLVILLIKPQFIFEVGFQLSYLAVFSIVLIQPPLYRLYVPKNRIIKYLWGIFTVTLAAQAGVLPLSLFYFHQFPGLFFVSNLVILPFLGIILFMGIVIMLLAVLNVLPQIIVEFYAFLIHTLNDFVNWVAGQESFLFEDIPFSRPQTIASYILIFAIIVLLRNFNYKNLIYGLCSVILLQLVFFYEDFQTNSREFVIFHKSRNTIIAKKENQKLLLSHNLIHAPEEENMVKDYVMGKKINDLESKKLQNIYEIQNELLLLIDSTDIYQNLLIEPKYILLSQSPEINLDRLIKELRPQQIIADGSNYKSYVERWRKTCSKGKIPFHYTGKKGAFILQSFEPID